MCIGVIGAEYLLLSAFLGYQRHERKVFDTEEARTRKKGCKGIKLSATF